MTDTNAGPVLAEDSEWILRGAAPRDAKPADEDDDDDDQEDDADGAEDQDDDDADEDADDDDDSDDDDEDDDADDDDETDEVKSLKAEIADRDRRIANLRLRIKARERQNRELRDQQQQGKSKPEPKGKAANAKAADSDREDDETARENERLKRELADQRVRSAFDAEDKVKWHDPDVAFGLIDLDDVRDPDGKVDREALRDALTDLAKERPYLVKTTERPKAKAKPARPTGAQPGAHKRDRSKPDRAALESRYGALRGRS
jgi:hypothetical protein